MILKLIGLGILYYSFIRISGLVTLALILLTFYIKKVTSHMDEEKWDAYFEEVTAKGLLVRGLILCAASLVVASFISCYVFKLFAFNYALQLSIFTFILGSVYTTVKYMRKKEEVMARLRRICQFKKNNLDESALNHS